MKKNLSLLFLAILSSCAPAPKEASVEYLRFGEPVRLGTADALSDFNADARSATLLFFPQAAYLSDFSFVPNEAASEGESRDWDVVFSGASDEEAIPDRIPMEDHPQVKLAKLTHIILSASTVRDRSWAIYQKLSASLVAISDQRNARLESIYEAFPCFEIKEGEHRRRCLSAPSELTKPEPKTIRSCRSFARLDFADFDEDRQNEFDAAVVECEDIFDLIEARMEALRAQRAVLKTKREKSKAIVLRLLQSLQRRHGEKLLMSLSTIEEADVNGSRSRVKLSDDETQVEEFTLFIDSGSGSREYSLENGGIPEARFIETRFGVKVIRTRIQLDADTSILVDLAPSFHPIFGLRLTGTALIKSPGKNLRQGLLKLEFSKQGEEPYSLNELFDRR